MGTVVIDCPPDSKAPLMRIGGMSVVERHVREQLRAGQTVKLRCTPEVFSTLEDFDLTRLAVDEDIPEAAQVISATRLLEIELDSKRAQKRAEWKLMETCRRPYDGISDRFIWRHFSLRITRLVARLPVSPNAVTLVASVLGLYACSLFLWHGEDHLAVAAAGGAMILSLILDSVDGEIARVRHKGSKLGMWLDNVADDVIDTLLMVCIGASLGGTWFLIAAVAAGLRAFSTIVIFAGAAKLGHPGDVMAFRWWFESEQETTAVYEDLNLTTLLRSFGRRDTYVTVFAICFALNFPLGALLLASVNAASHGGLALLHLFLSRR